MQQDFIQGLPRRMGAALAGALSRGAFNEGTKRKIIAVIENVQNEHDKLPVTAMDDEIMCSADMLTRIVYGYADKYKDGGLIVDGITLLCRRMGVSVPLGKDDAEKIKRACDRGWWFRALRKEHGRRFEHTAIQTGFVSYRAGIYISHESAIRQIKQNEANAKLLARTTLVNELGQEFPLDELAALGVANKAIRRGELMTRIRGFEEVAKDLGHSGMFWTITAPSKFHAVLAKSGHMNPTYEGATPREAQAYLCSVWARIRAAFKRAGIQPYGFRIAEPHHDGCPHWHMLLFVAQEHVQQMNAIIHEYALKEDGNEKGAQENRVKLVEIEAGKGTAAGYIIKYVCKNVDGNGVGDHKTLDGWTVTNDLLGNQEITPSQRVTLWSQWWGIRQFQQIGGVPVGIWREFRRIKAEAVLNAPSEIKAAWVAVQKTGEQLADWAAFCRALGGVTVGRRALVQLSRKEVEIVGRYATYIQDKPCGVYSVVNKNAVYESVRYQWTRVESAGGGAVDLPWTGVNNCTQSTKDDEPYDGENTKLIPDANDIETYLQHRKNSKAHYLAYLQQKWEH